MHKLPPLPYEKDALEPLISAETLDYHYGKHHKAYVDKINILLQDSPLKELSLTDLIQQSQGAIFNNAAQIWNHTFLWHCMTPEKKTQPSTALLSAIEEAFDSLENFKEKFLSSALNNFGSGWTWLVLDGENKLQILNTSNADTPIKDNNHHPLLTCDVWEHAYYIDTRNNRAQYLENFWTLINWTFVNDQFVKYT